MSTHVKISALFSYDLRNIKKQIVQGANDEKFGVQVGKEVKVNTPDGYNTENKYDLNGNLTQFKDKAGNISYYAYDENNKPVSKKVPIEKDSSGGIIYSVENVEYDQVGNVITKTLTGTKNTESTRTMKYYYYDNNLLRQTVDPMGAYTNIYYDKDGNLIKTEKQRDGDMPDISKYEYDTQDRVVKKIQLVSQSTIDGAEDFKNLQNLKNPQNPDKLQLITAYEYDVMGNKIKEISPKAFMLNVTLFNASIFNLFADDLLRYLQIS